MKGDDVEAWWRRVLILFAIFVCLLAAYVWRDRLGADFVPLDASRIGPNLVASAVQALVVGVIAVLVFPPVRRRVHRFMDRKLDAVHDRLDSLDTQLGEHRTQVREHAEWMARHTAALYRAHTGREPEDHPHFDLKDHPKA